MTKKCRIRCVLGLILLCCNLARGEEIALLKEGGEIQIESSFVDKLPPVQVVVGKWTWSTRGITVPIPGTPYSALIIDGVVQPTLVDRVQNRAWDLRGLSGVHAGSSFSDVNDLVVEPKRVRFFVRGADLTVEWVIDFSDPKGVRISYEFEN